MCNHQPMAVGLSSSNTKATFTSSTRTARVVDVFYGPLRIYLQGSEELIELAESFAKAANQTLPQDSPLRVVMKRLMGNYALCARCAFFTRLCQMCSHEARPTLKHIFQKNAIEFEQRATRHE